MGLVIESEKAQDLARQIAALTGKSAAEAVREALEEKLARIQDGSRFAMRLRRIREVTDNLPPPPAGASSDHSDLYDENGLPK